MKEKMKKILDSFHRYNSDKMAYQAFGLSDEVEYDALIVAPSYTPYKILNDSNCKITTLRQGTYIAGYLVEKDGLQIAWIQISAGPGTLIDHIALCAELKFKKMIFIGAVGSLVEQYQLGDICTPSYSISGGYTNTYLKDSLQDFVPFERVDPPMEYIDRVIEMLKKEDITLKKASVFCTDSIALEYFHLDEIRAFHTDLIEMETSSFYRMADLLEIPSIALLVVSDNSATGTPLVGRSEQEQQRYEKAKRVVLSDMIFKIIQVD
ncbi:MAG: hypothetical protein ACOX6P_06530 [Candidatus Merdivicinus sp.]|jgi:purine-nucleoside phosphorylase